MDFGRDLRQKLDEIFRERHEKYLPFIRRPAIDDRRSSPSGRLDAAGTGQSRPAGNRWLTNRGRRATGDRPIPRCRRDTRQSLV